MSWEAVSEYTPIWNFNEEKSIEGVFLKEDKTVTKHGEKEVYVLQKNDGSKVHVFKSQNLAFKMEGNPEKNIPPILPGTKIRIEHLGKFKNENSGKNYNAYKVMRWHDERKSDNSTQKTESTATSNEPSVDNILF